MQVDFQEAQEEAQTQRKVYTDQIEDWRQDLILPTSNIINYHRGIKYNHNYFKKHTNVKIKCTEQKVKVIQILN